MKRLLQHLSELVSFDTRNPPRDPAGVAALYDYVVQALRPVGYSVVEERDVLDGCRLLLLERGASVGLPLVNIHVDTVPFDGDWQTNPFELALHDGAAAAPRRFDAADRSVPNATSRAVGLGACDIKGALASYLRAAEETTGPGALLLTSDEEAGDSRCVRLFVELHPMASTDVMVAEPTMCRAVCVHRGIGTCRGVFRGSSGHASRAHALADSANHQAVQWAHRALELAASRPEVRFNLGIINGGVKSNMIAASCVVRFGVRPPFGVDSAGIVDDLCALAPDPARVEWETGYVAPPLPAPGRRSDSAERLVASLGLPLGEPVDFFTEAALFSQAGARAFVFGPGDIAQAHAAGEWVALSQLDQARHVYARLLGGPS